MVWPMGESISKTHEWRRLDQFVVGDTIHNWGSDLDVLRIETLPDGSIELWYRNQEQQVVSITDRKHSEYIAAKRDEQCEEEK